MLSIPGIAVVTLLYESANSLVYRAIREADRQLLILKLLKESYPTPQELLRYRTELITEETYSRLENPSQYAICTLDTVKVKGKSEAVTVYELFDCDRPEIKAAS